MMCQDIVLSFVSNQLLTKRVQNSFSTFYLNNDSNIKDLR